MTQDDLTQYGFPKDLLDEEELGSFSNPINLDTAEISEDTFEPQYEEQEEPSSEVAITDGIELPDNSFLLRSPAGDAYLFPRGFSEEEAFIVLFFEDLKNLNFYPTLGTHFLGAVDVGEEVQYYNLYYSGITFQLPESTQVAIIFHKVLR